MENTLRKLSEGSATPIASKEPFLHNFFSAPPIFNEAVDPIDALVEMVERGHYDKLMSIVRTSVILSPAEIVSQFEDAPRDTILEFDQRTGGENLNFDLCGFDIDQDTVILETRHFFQRNGNGLDEVLRDYAIVGRNEMIKDLFPQPVSALAGTRKYYRHPTTAGRVEQRRIWSCPEKLLATGLARGDFVIVAPKGKPAHAEMIDADTVVVVEINEVRASAPYRNPKGVTSSPRTGAAASERTASQLQWGWRIVAVEPPRTAGGCDEPLIRIQLTLFTTTSGSNDRLPGQRAKSCRHAPIRLFRQRRSIELFPSSFIGPGSRTFAYPIWRRVPRKRLNPISLDQSSP